MSALPEHLRPLLTPEPYPHPVGCIRLVETHVSWLFLTGEVAYKIKRPVHYPFVDLRPLDRRLFFCEEELRLGRRFAPALYLDVCPVIQKNGRLKIDGTGDVLEYAVRMRQFAAEEGLDQLVASGRIDVRELEEFGRVLATRQQTLPVARPSQGWGDPQTVRRLVLDNIAECLQCAAALGTHDEVRALGETFTAMLPELAPLMAERRKLGRVRECHGDLHSRNVVRYQGRLLAFDCMEFEPAFRWIDVAEEIAFLVMDLQVRCARPFAHAFLSGFLAGSGDYQACRIMRFYAIHRALVRAKVAALEASVVSDADARTRAIADHRALLDGIRRLLAPVQPVLLLMCGLSGSGKTWLANRLSPLLDAVHLRSDVERKRLAGLGERDQSMSGLGRDLYSEEANARLMDHLLRCTSHALSGKFSVIVDATFGRRGDRERLRCLALAEGVVVRMIFCHAPDAVLKARILDRQQNGADASEADLQVLEWQKSRYDALGPDEPGVIDADTTRADIVNEVEQALRQSV